LIEHTAADRLVERDMQVWTVDFILGDKDADGKDTYHVGEFNCSCVGVTQQLHLCPLVADAVLEVCNAALGAAAAV
jgi:hypothetical protein